jgi:hypothetical protein
MKFEPMQYDMKVRSVTKIDREKEKGEETFYRLMARDKDGINEITIVSASNFKGISPKDGVIQIVIKNSQKSLDDFKEPEKRGRPKKSKTPMPGDEDA